MVWSLLMSGLGGGVCLAAGHFGAAAVLAGAAIWEYGRAHQRLELSLIEFCLLAGLVYFYRESVSLQCLALFALLGAVIEAQVRGSAGLTEGRVAERLRWLVICAGFAALGGWFGRAKNPMMPHFMDCPIIVYLVVCSVTTHWASAGGISRLLTAARKSAAAGI